VRGIAAYGSAFRSRVIPRCPANRSHAIINLCCFRRKISLSQQGELLGGHNQIVFFEPCQINLNRQNDLFLNGLAGGKPLNTHAAAVYQAVAMGRRPNAPPSLEEEISHVTSKVLKSSARIADKTAQQCPLSS
jgi:hypothetical protein